MDVAEMSRLLCRDGVVVIEAPGVRFFVYDPGRDLPESRRLPFATIVTDDTYDRVSRLNRPGSYRVNLGLTKATYVSMFGAAPTRRDADGVLMTGFDYAAVDTVMPHPMYASQYWVCVVNPGSAAAIDGLVTEAYEFAVRKHVNAQARRT